MSTTTLTYREALRAALREELARDERVLLLGEDIGAFGGPFQVTKGLIEDFGERRVRDAPSAEAGLVGVAAGAAMVGLRPVVELMTITASIRALDQLIATVAQVPWSTGGALTVPLVLRTVQGSGQQLGPTQAHHLEALFAHVPGLIVVAPSTPADAKALLKAAIRSTDPVVFIEHEALYSRSGEVSDDPDAVLPLGRAVTRREGRDLTLVSWSRGAQSALEAADVLEREHGISAEVIDLRSLRPLDLNALTASVHRTNRMVVVEDGWPLAGVASSIAALVQEQAFDYLDAPILRVSGTDAPVGYARTLEAAHRADPRAIAQAALQALYR